MIRIRIRLNPRDFESAVFFIIGPLFILATFFGMLLYIFSHAAP